MLSNKPYLIRAFYQWIIDNACTPFLNVDPHFPGCSIPQEYIDSSELTLNISPFAIRDLVMDNDKTEFRTSFSGVVHILSIPTKAILAIYAQENQEGMFFDYEEPDENDRKPIAQSAPQKEASHLQLVEDTE